jgi:ABC-type dipeptide/oligopeptide/nickel transport system permease component
MIKRLLGIIPVVFGVISLTFLLIHAVPGDPVEVMLGESVSNADRVKIRAELGLDQSIYVQFGVYLNKLVHGDLGVSIHSRKPIMEMLKERLPATFKLACASSDLCYFFWVAFRNYCCYQLKKMARSNSEPLKSHCICDAPFLDGSYVDDGICFVVGNIACKRNGK